jgi:RNA polymerase sigma-70 factor (ECF subfamily)
VISKGKLPRGAGRKRAVAEPPEEGSELRAQFEALALPHLDSLYRTGLRMTRSREEAEDLVQETYMKAFRSFRTFQPDTNIRAWLFKIMTNSYINRYRKQSAEPTKARFQDVKAFLSSAEAAETTAAAEDMQDFDLDERLDGEVKQALEELPEEFRIVVVMALVEGLSYKEIARTLDIPIGTVMSRLYRGRHALKQRLADYARAQGYREA